MRTEDTVGQPIMEQPFCRTAVESFAHMLSLAKTNCIRGFALVAVVDFPDQEGVTFITQLDPGDAGVARLYYGMDWCKTKMLSPEAEIQEEDL